MIWYCISSILSVSFFSYAQPWPYIIRITELVKVLCYSVLVSHSMTLKSKRAVSHALSTAHLSTLQWHHNRRHGVSNHQPDDCLLNRLFRHRSQKTLKLRVTGLCTGNSPVTGEFPAQRPVTPKDYDPGTTAARICLWNINIDFNFLSHTNTGAMQVL